MDPAAAYVDLRDDLGGTPLSCAAIQVVWADFLAWMAPRTGSRASLGISYSGISKVSSDLNHHSRYRESFVRSEVKSSECNCVALCRLNWRKESPEVIP